jgi:hypothetical protein
MKEITLILSEGLQLPWTAGLSTDEIKISSQAFIKLEEFLLRTKTFFRIIEFPIAGFLIDGKEKVFKTGRKVVIVEDYDSLGRGGLRLVLDANNNPLIKK